MNANTIFKGMALCVSFLMMSCNDTSELANEGNNMKVFFTVDKFESTSATRTTVDPTNNYAITWASGDAIGIFPREGHQEPFVIPTDQIGKSNASFDGGYWALKEGLTYNAYYPFDKANFESAEMKTKIPVTYLGQEQDGTTCGIGAYDYTYSDWIEATSGSVNFKFHHIGAFAIFTLKYPATATYTKLTLSANTAIIPTTGTYDLTAEEVNFVADNDGLASSISLTLKNCSGTAGETGMFYMMLPPMDLSGSKLALTLTNSEGTSQSYSLESFNAVKGKKYELACELTSYYKDGVAFVANAGELPSIIPTDEKNTITSLKVVGNLNGTDIKFIREMAGAGDVVNNVPQVTDGTLARLDISETTIVEGGDVYCTINGYRFYETSDNTLGAFFFESSILEEIILPNNITSIGDFAFNACAKLQNLTIPNSVTTIGDNPFFNCTNLASVTVGTNVPTIKVYTINPVIPILYVPAGYKTTYETTSLWRYLFSEIVEIE